MTDDRRHRDQDDDFDRDTGGQGSPPPQRFEDECEEMPSVSFDDPIPKDKKPGA